MSKFKVGDAVYVVIHFTYVRDARIIVVFPRQWLSERRYLVEGDFGRYVVRQRQLMPREVHAKKELVKTVTAVVSKATKTRKRWSYYDRKKQSARLKAYWAARRAA